MTENFSRHEFACKGEDCCGHTAAIELATVQKCQAYRAILETEMGRPIPVSPTSGFRCLTHNRSIGSNDESQHPKGLAVDFPKVDGLGIDRQERLLEMAGFVGIGKYDWGCHGDNRKGPRARWDERTV